MWPVAYKIINFLGMTSLGQKTAANSISTVTASGHTVPVSGPLTNTELRASAVPVSGALTDTELRASAVPVSAGQLPAALGQTNAAGSVSVVQASDDPLVAAIGTTADAAVDTDAAGTISAKLRGLVKLFVNLLSRWPASLGQKALAASLPVVMASDQTPIPVEAAETWFAFRGLLAADDCADGEDGVGVVNSKVQVYASIGADDSLAPTLIEDAADIQTYFRGASASMNGDPVWVYIPLVALGWRNFWLQVRNNLGMNVDVAIYGAMTNRGTLFAGGSSPLRQVTDGAGIVALGTATLADAASAVFGNGGNTFLNLSQWPYQYILVKLDPSGDPASGSWSLFCSLAS